MPEPTPIALTQLVLWYDPTRIQAWPSFLASLPAGAIARTPTDLGRTFGTGRMTSERHAAAFDLVRNLPGLELRGGRFQLRGVGLLQRTPGGYGVSRRGRALTDAYVAGLEGPGWPLLLADLLLGREPRTRALVRLLSDHGAHLVFQGHGWFEGSYRRARLARMGEPDTFPFDGSGEHSTLREPLAQDAWWCLGDWRADPFLDGSTECRFCGTREGKGFSLHDIGLALRAACEVLLVAGLLQCNGGAVRFDTTAAARLLPERAADFGWQSGTDGPADLLIALGEVMPVLRSATGHIVASELREALRAGGVPDPDRALAAAERAGRLLIYAEDYGQSRHGMGLFGDPRKQLVKLRIIGPGDQQ